MVGQRAEQVEAQDKRTFTRVPIALAGKVFFPATDAERDCIVTDISLGGATVQCGVRIETGTELVLYLQGFDRFAGIVVRADAEEAGMRFNCSPAKRERTAEKIVLYLSGKLPQDTQVRRSERSAVPAPRRFTRPDGEVVAFEVRDISLTGASLKTTVRPPIGETVMIGATPGRITRHLDDGIALEFIKQGE
jgi:PilZ domain